MRYEYRVSKYNPKFRDADGVYQRNEWTSYSNINRRFDRKIFTLAQYCDVEEKYVASIHSILNECKINNLVVSYIENRRKVVKLKLGEVLHGKRLDSIVRNVLREKLWVKLQAPRRLFVHFGWDFYLYIGSSCSIPKSLAMIEKAGLYHEVFESPYKG